MAKTQDVHIQYLPATEQDKSWGTIITSVGFHDIKPSGHYPPAGHPMRYLFSVKRGRILNEYQLIYLTHGKGTFESSSQKKAEIKSGNMQLLFPDEWHTYYPDSATGWNEYWIGFKSSAMDERVRNGFFAEQKPIFQVGLQEEIVRLYNLAIEVARNQRAGFQQMLGGIVDLLLGYAYSFDKHQSFEELQVVKQINAAKILMQERFANGISAEQVAQELRLGYSWFRHLFKKFSGFAPNQYILELKISKAKSLLTNTDRIIKEIAYECGFENLEYFCSIFKKKEGMTPTQYRQMTQMKTLGKNNSGETFGK